MAAKLRKGDEVIVLAGKDKGKKGTVTLVVPRTGKAIVDGVNMAIRHERQTPLKVGVCPKQCLLIFQTYH